MDLTQQPSSLQTPIGTMSWTLPICTSALEFWVVNRYIGKEAATVSDHRMLKFNIISPWKFCPEVPATVRINWENTNWNKFPDHLEQASDKTKNNSKHVLNHSSHQGISRKGLPFSSTSSWMQQLRQCLYSNLHVNLRGGGLKTSTLLAVAH